MDFFLNSGYSPGFIERDTMSAPIPRRAFLAASIAAPLPALGNLITDPAGVDLAADRTLTAADAFGPACQRVETPRGRARVAILFAPGFRPRSWRDIPEGGEIVKLLPPSSLRDARKRAKAFNRARGSAADCWGVVICQDGRKPIGGRAKGGVA